MNSLKGAQKTMHKWSVRLGAAVFAAAVAFTLKGQAPAPATQGPVTSERLLNAADEPGNWMMYSHSYNSWRYSSLDQINAQTVKNLHVKWMFQGRHIEKFETTPLVVNGIMYLTRPENAIYALDAATGRQLWSYEYHNPARTYNCCGKGESRPGDAGQYAVHEHARHARGCRR